MPKDAVGKARILEVHPSDVVESFGSVRSAHAIDLDNDEANLGNLSATVIFLERLGHEGIVWASVDVLDHRVGLIRIEIGGAEDHTPDVGDTVATFGNEYFWGFPTCVDKIADVCPFDLHYYRLVRSPPQFCDGRHVDA